MRRLLCLLLLSASLAKADERPNFVIIMVDDMGYAGVANSGLFLNDRYEIQILDSFGKLACSGDCGALYNYARPRVNASLPPGVWQT